MAITDLSTAQGLAGIMNEALTNYFGRGSYQIDTTSLESIEAGFGEVGAYPAEMKNSLLNQVNLVLIYRNYGTMFTESKNPTRRFWRDAIRYGDGIADIYQEILEPISGIQGIWAEDYAGQADTSELALNNAKYHFNFHKGDVQKKFHVDTTRRDFAISVSELEISKAFTPEGFAGYINVKIANLQWSAEVHLLTAAIENMRKMVTDQNIIFSTGHNLNNQNGVTETVETIRTITDSMTSLSRSYNKAGIITISDSEDLYLLTTPQFLQRIGVRGAANAFNINEYRLQNRVLILPEDTDFGKAPNGETVHAMLVDRRAIVMAMRYWKMAPFVPTGADWQNYFLKIEYLHGYNDFFNAVAFAGEPIDDFFDNARGATVIIGTANGTSEYDVIETDGVLVGEYDEIDSVIRVYNNASYVAPRNDYITLYNGTLNGVEIDPAALTEDGLTQYSGFVRLTGKFMLNSGDVFQFRI